MISNCSRSSITGFVGVALRVLLADDEADLLMLGQGFLEACGYQVETVPSGEQALEILKLQSFDVFVSDLNMPGTSGRSLIEQVNVQDPSLKIIVMSGESVEAVKDLLDGLFISSVLSKPCPMSAIDRAIRTLSKSEKAA